VRAAVGEDDTLVAVRLAHVQGKPAGERPRAIAVERQTVLYARTATDLALFLLEQGLDLEVRGQDKNRARPKK